MMSQENVEIAKRGVDAFNRRDLSTHDELCTIFDFRDGKCSRHCVYLDRDEALRAAGVCE